MARTVIPLTDTKIKNAKPKAKDYPLSDGKGLQLNIKTNGSKLWEFRYLSPTTRQRRKSSFGNYPTISLSEARDKRNEYHKLISSGIDLIDHFKEIKNKRKRAK